MNGFDPSHFDPSAMIAAMSAFYGVIAFVGLAIAILLSYLLYTLYTAVPEQHRVMRPEMVWLLLIPCFGVIWNFWVYPGLSKSFKSYFDSVGDTTVGDCGKALAIWFCVCVFCCGPAALVLLIIFMIRAFELKNKIKAV